MKPNPPTGSSRQPPRLLPATLIVRLSLGLCTSACQVFRRNGSVVRRCQLLTRRTLAPTLDHEHHQHCANHQVEERHDPGDQAEAGLWRLKIHREAKLLLERM